MKESARVRLIMFAIAFPAVTLIPFLLPQLHSLVLAIAVCAVSVIGAFELERLVRQRGPAHGPALVVLYGLTIPVVAYLAVSGYLPEEAMLIALAALALLTLSLDIFARQDVFETTIAKVSTGLLLSVYPGFLLSYVTRIANQCPDNLAAGRPVQLLVYLIMNFGNDSMAYATGMLFGRRRGIVAASPSKSLAGFIGGALTSVAVAVAAYYVCPEYFPGQLWKAIVLGAAIGFLTIAGDLAESALKRGASIKDSGTIMPGRGGILDSVDSVVFTAPAFYYLYRFLFLS
jgi:phosphatidate cytidylyltransferase